MCLENVIYLIQKISRNAKDLVVVCGVGRGSKGVKNYEKIKTTKNMREQNFI